MLDYKYKYFVHDVQHVLIILGFARKNSVMVYSNSPVVSVAMFTPLATCLLHSLFLSLNGNRTVLVVFIS